MKLRAVAVAVVLSGCTPSLLPVDKCTANTECRDAFGYGSVCGESGLCETTEVHPRCDATYPLDLTLPLDTSTTYLNATLFGRTDAHIARYRGAQLAMMRANASDALLEEFALLHCSYEEDPAIDGLTSDEAVAEVSRWLADEVGVRAIIGPAASSLSGTVYTEVATEFDTLIVSPSATSDTLIQVDGDTSTDAAPGLFWRTAPPDSGQTAAIVWDMTQHFDDPLTEPEVEYFREHPTASLAIIHQDGLYGEGLALSVAAAFEDLQLTTALFRFESPGQRAEQIAAVAEGSFDEVLFISSDAVDYVAFLDAAEGIPWYADKPLFLTDGGRTTDLFATTSTTLFDNVRGSVPALPEGFVFNTFNSDYQGEFQVDANEHSFTAHTYDAGWLVAYGHVWAAQRESEVTGTTIARGLRKISVGDEVKVFESDFARLVSAFQEGRSVDVDGASGSLDYDPTTGETSAAIEIWTVQPGQTFERDELFSP